MNILPSSPQPRRRTWLAGALGIVGAVIALLPWWKNHATLRDFYDYGLVVAANARIETGERPYVDFTTPIQAGFLWFNHASERFNGSTYLGMTNGAAVLIGIAALGLALLLARRWPPLPAAFVATGIVIGSATQHTIIWHNNLGALSLAVLVIAGAVAPVLRRETWGWHGLATAALWLSGVNKINFHLLAVAILLGWALRARILGQANNRDLRNTATWLLLCGFGLPIASELLWTGASFGQWWTNVIGLPLSGRSTRLGEAVQWQSLWQPVHDYYGKQRLPAVGILAIWPAVGAGLCAWRSAPRELWPRLLVLGATTLGAIGAFGLLATNFEIGYVAAAAGLALGAGLWLGFQLPARGRGFWWSLLLPTLLLGAAGWDSAWRGQRSQFGHSTAARTDYLDVASAGPEFTYFAGLRMPPEIVHSLTLTKEVLPPRNDAGLYPVLFGPGLEWLERALPAVKFPGLPLWMHFGTSYGPRELEQLQTILAQDPDLRGFYTAVAWRYMLPTIDALLDSNFDYNLYSEFIARWLRNEVVGGPPIDAPRQSLRHILGTSNLTDFQGHLNTNLILQDITMVGSQAAVLPRSAETPMALGTRQGITVLEVPAGIRRIRGQALAHRPASDHDSPVLALFAVRSSTTGSVLWSGRIELPPEQTNAQLEFLAINSGDPMELAVTFDGAPPPSAFAGFRDIHIEHIEPDHQPPPRLHEGAPDASETPLRDIRSQLPPGDWSLQAAENRGVAFTPEGMRFAPGAELWFKPDRPLAEVQLDFACAPSEAAPRMPVLRFVWTKGSRIEYLTQTSLQHPSERLVLRGWTPEPDGWFGVMIDANADTAPALVRVVYARP